VSFQRKDPFQKLEIGWCSARMRYNPHGCLKEERREEGREKGQEELIMRMRREKKEEEEERRRRSEKGQVKFHTIIN
jgi:hypothetical protein